MISLTAAMELLDQTVAPLPIGRLPLAECLGLTLAADVVSEVESPPFDKALMDGYAVQSGDVSTGKATLRVIEQVMAGQVATQAVTPGTAIQIMTGAPLPAVADAVVKVEDTRSEGDLVSIDGRPVRPEANLIRRGAALKIGERVLLAGAHLTPSRIGVLAELGWSQVPVRRRPRVAVLATGDELVPVGQPLGPGQIRNTNEVMLTAAIGNCGGIAVPLGIAKDNRTDLAAKIQAGLAHDVLVLSGGVSAGKLDLVPSELANAGVEEVFHKVFIKPGKPVWFGGLQKRDGAGVCLVFGLPGNPVSSMVCFELFVHTAIRRLLGQPQPQPLTVTAVVENNFLHRSDRPTYHPAAVTEPGGPGTTGQRAVRILPWQGSSDLRSTADANAMAVLDEGERQYHPGDTVPVILWE